MFTPSRFGSATGSPGSWPIVLPAMPIRHELNTETPSPALFTITLPASFVVLPDVMPISSATQVSMRMPWPRLPGADPLGANPIMLPQTSLLAAEAMRMPFWQLAIQFGPVALPIRLRRAPTTDMPSPAFVTAPERFRPVPIRLASTRFGWPHAANSSGAEISIEMPAHRAAPTSLPRSPPIRFAPASCTSMPTISCVEALGDAGWKPMKLSSIHW